MYNSYYKADIKRKLYKDLYMKIKSISTLIHIKIKQIPELITVIIISLLFYSSPVLSEENDDSAYEDKSSNFLIKPFAGLSFMEFGFDRTDGKENEIAYTAKPRVLTGLSISWDFLGISAGYRLPVTDEDFGQIDNEESFDLRLNYYGRYIGCDLYIQHQKGFFLDQPEDQGIEYNDDGSLPYYDSIGVDNISLNLYYIFSWKTFSLRAAFDGTDIQKKTASSFLLMISGGQLGFNSTSSLLLDKDTPSEDRMHGLKSCDYRYVSLSPGYGWTLIFSEKYYFNFIVFLGLGIQDSIYSSDSGKFQEWSCFPDPDIRFAIGYASDRFLYGFSITTEIHMSPEEEIETDYFLINALFYAGYRFF